MKYVLPVVMAVSLFSFAELPSAKASGQPELDSLRPVRKVCRITRGRFGRVVKVCRIVRGGPMMNIMGDEVVEK